MSIFKDQDTIFIVNPTSGEDFKLASKVNGVWLCELCPTHEEYKTRMLNHVRYDHIEIK